MRCRNCREKAVIHMPAHKLALCGSCYISWFEGYTERTIQKFNMLKPGEQILVAVSGGKDSLALWQVLTRLGVNTTALYIHLGIAQKEYSDTSLAKARAFEERLNSSLIVIDVAKELGMSVPETKRLMSRKVCATCGLIKRYYMNKTAADGEFDAIATGHNLDDETASLLGNTMEWRLSYLKRQHPVLAERPPGLKKKVKPFCYFTEKETATYAFLTGIDYIMTECPYALHASSIEYKNVLNALEENGAGRKRRFYDHLLKAQGHLAFPEEAELNRCRICNQPTTLSVCSFCNISKKIREIKDKKPSAISRQHSAVAEV
ncbi:MAG: adenine nucleotide alpha hydrolase family protein [Candidatus Omnitrophica bacterium]|nr:adenine nucleotide alpha hydrolase family protein [Candidatus Omnitrophota bacterium]